MMNTYDYETDIKLEALVEEAYTLFSKYKLRKRLDICSCCVFDQEVKTLQHTPLALLSKELLQRAYYHSYYSDTEEELKEMKHFLPRILQVILEFEFPYPSEEIIFRHVNLLETQRWENEEIALLQQFARLYFRKVLHSCKMEADTALIMFGLAGFDLKPLLDEWKHSEGERPLLHLYNLLNYGVQHTEGKFSKLTNYFSTQAVDSVVMECLNDKMTRKIFSMKIEKMLLDDTVDLSQEVWAELDLLYALLNREYYM